LAGEANGGSWKGKKIGDPNRKFLENQAKLFLSGNVWVRADGALAIHALGGTPVTLELPQAAKYEAELKAIKERQSRAAVPRFKVSLRFQTSNGFWARQETS